MSSGTIFLIAYLALLGLAVAVDGPIMILYAVVGGCSYLAASVLGAFLRRKL
jgi:hypothetical protein